MAVFVNQRVAMSSQMATDITDAFGMGSGFARKIRKREKTKEAVGKNMNDNSDPGTLGEREVARESPSSALPISPATISHRSSRPIRVSPGTDSETTSPDRHSDQHELRVWRY